MIAAHTTVPVLGVPIETKTKGMDSLLSIVQMPGGVPVGTFSIGTAGAKNAGLLAQILALSDQALRTGWANGAQRQTVAERPDMSAIRTGLTFHDSSKNYRILGAGQLGR